MKLLILGDLHYGIKSFDYIIDQKLNSVFENIIFPYIKKHDIKHIVQLGDVFDDRKGVRSQSGYNYVKYFFLPIINNNLTLYQILGNHDVFYDKDNKINSLKMFFELVNKTYQYSNLKLIENYEKIILNNQELHFISYGCDVNMDDIYGDVLFGHYAVEGFEMQKNVPVLNGMRLSSFGNFDKVFTGHIHRRDSQKNVINVGSLVECDFGESDFVHGFYVLDINHMNVEFVPIEEKIFIRLNADEIEKYKNLNDMVVEIRLDEKNSELENEKIIQKFKNLNPKDVKIKYINKEKSFENIEVKNYDFLNVLKEYIDNDGSNMNKDILLKIIMKFYNEI